MSSGFEKEMSLSNYLYNVPKSVKLQGDDGQTKFEFVAMETGLKLQAPREGDSDTTESTTIDMFANSGV